MSDSKKNFNIFINSLSFQTAFSIASSHMQKVNPETRLKDCMRTYDYLFNL